MAADESSAAGPERLSEDCFDELENGTADEIACLFPIRLSDDERAQLKAGSRGFIENVGCTLTVRIARREVEAAIWAAELVFQSPEQPVVCTVTTPRGNFDVTATFAPRVAFKGDKAIDATPGLGNVTGVSRVLSWPVVLFVNRWPSVRSGLMRIVDAYRTHARKRPRATPPAE